MGLSGAAIGTYRPQYRPLSAIRYLDVNPLPTRYTLFITFHGGLLHIRALSCTIYPQSMEDQPCDLNCPRRKRPLEMTTRSPSIP
jgi:hypothetical protein